MDSAAKQTYEQPLLTRHEKLLDITGSFGSGKGKESTETQDGTSKFSKEGKEWYKEGKDGW